MGGRAERLVVVVTGASGGIGAAFARRMGRDGHRLVLGARRREELARVAADSGDAMPVVTDVTRRPDVERLRDAALDAYGHVDVWVNNAGRGITRRVLDLTDEDVDEMMLVNVKSALYGMQAIVPHFVERGRGHLVNVSSALSRVPSAVHRSMYSAAKHALNSLTANLRMDLRQAAPEVRVSLVMPGVVTTDFARNVRGGASEPLPGTGMPGATGPIVPQTADEVAEVMARLVEEPVAEVMTNPAQAPVVRRYFEDVGAWEEEFAERRAAAAGAARANAT